MSGANLYPILITAKRGRIIPLGDPIKTEHTNSADLMHFEGQLALLYARFRETIEKQIKLMDVEIRYPYNTMLGVLKRIKAPKKASFEAADQFSATNGDQPCTAYELYMAMSEVIFMAQCDGASGSRISQLEECIARAVHAGV